MRKLILSLIILAACVSARAQAQLPEEEKPKPAFSIGPEIGLPARGTFSLAYGGSARVEIPVKAPWIISVTGGYTVLQYKKAFTNLPGNAGITDPKYIPLKAGVRYTPTPNFYLLGELGTALEAEKSGVTSKGNLFVYAVGPGFLLKLTEKQNVDIGLRYEQWSSGVLSQTALRVAYRISL